MAVIPTEAQQYPQTENPGDEHLGIDVPVVSPFRFGPETWNWLYYAILGVSLLVGLLALLNGGSVVDALLYFFISLMGTTLLSIAFLSFVIMPLYVKHHQRTLAARRAAVLARKAAAIEKIEREKVERYQSMVAQLQDEVLPIVQSNNESVPDEVPKAATVPPEVRKPIVEDQASSLRRMVAESPAPSL